MWPAPMTNPVLAVTVPVEVDHVTVAAGVVVTDGLTGNVVLKLMESMAGFMLELVERVAATESTILITGETGTGKELISQAIHALALKTSTPQEWERARQPMEIG